MSAMSAKDSDTEFMPSDLRPSQDVQKVQNDINIQDKLVFEQASTANRLAQLSRFTVLSSKRTLAEANFWIRTPRLINRIEQVVNSFNNHGLKSQILRYLWRYFDSGYSQIVSST